MGTGEESSDVQLARLKWDREKDAEEMKGLRGDLRAVTERLEKMTRQPPRVELHDGSIHASCPNCGTESTAALPPVTAQPTNFDDVISLLDSKHREANGERWDKCPSCAPKMAAKLKEFGYGPLAAAPAPSA